jgi:hypothetical protein
MNLKLLVTKDCNACKRVGAQLKLLTSRNSDLNLIITDINDFKKIGIVIAPALFIEDELFCYGDVNETKLILKITELKHKSDCNINHFCPK